MIEKNRNLEMLMSVCLLISAFCFFACGTKVEKQKEVSTEWEEEKQLGYRVVLDAGHGDTDSGKVAVNGAYEKDINLAIVLFLKEELETKGIDVVLTRENDEPLYTASDHNKKMADMKKRIALITESNADIVVSIHQNSYPDESIKGPQVFYYTGSEEGKKLATILQESFSLVVGTEQNKRFAKANSEYYLLLHTPCVCVIAECGFLSNQEEADLLETELYQKNMAKALAEGIMNYFSQKEK